MEIISGSPNEGFPTTAETKTTSQVKRAKLNSSHNREFSMNEQIDLAGHVKLKPAIWQIDHPHHKLPDAHVSAWKKIAAAMDIPGTIYFNSYSFLKIFSTTFHSNSISTYLSLHCYIFFGKKRQIANVNGSL
jgi:hypothetical protein